MSLCLGTLRARASARPSTPACRSSPPRSSASPPPSPAPALVGFVNGVIIAKLKVPAFIVTLGTSFIVRGVALLMAENTTVIGLPPGIRAYGNEALVYLVRGEGGGLYLLAPPEVSGELLRRMDRILPYPVVITAIVVAIAMFLLRKTQFGRHTYALGGNMEAARRAGIPVDRRHHRALHALRRHRRHRRLPLDAALLRRLGRHRRPAPPLLDRGGHHRRRQPLRRRRLASSAR